MKPSVYIETTIIGYLATRVSGILRVAANQETTRDWWDNHRQRFEHADDARRRDATGPDEQQIALAQFLDAHLGDGFRTGFDDGGIAFADEKNQRDDDEITEHRPGHHHRGGPHADDVADAQQLRRHGGRELRRLVDEVGLDCNEQMPQYSE